MPDHLVPEVVWICVFIHSAALKEMFLWCYEELPCSVEERWTILTSSSCFEWWLSWLVSLLFSVSASQFALGHGVILWYLKLSWVANIWKLSENGGNLSVEWWAIGHSYYVGESLTILLYIHQGLCSDKVWENHFFSILHSLSQSLEKTALNKWLGVWLLGSRMMTHVVSWVVCSWLVNKFGFVWLLPLL